VCAGIDQEARCLNDGSSLTVADLGDVFGGINVQGMDVIYAGNGF
jgi:hypothetical protein